MKKEYLVGRWNEADIVINDESDQVSRRHAIVTRSLWGKIRLRDISANGTYLNGERLAPDREVTAHRSDKVSLAQVWDFDLRAVPDPYKGLRILLIASLLALVAIGGSCAWWFTRPTGQVHPVPIVKDGTTIHLETKETTDTPQKAKSPSEQAVMTGKKLRQKKRNYVRKQQVQQPSTPQRSNRATQTETGPSRQQTKQQSPLIY